MTLCRHFRHLASLTALKYALLLLPKGDREMLENALVPYFEQRVLEYRLLRMKQEIEG